MSHGKTGYCDALEKNRIAKQKEQLAASVSDLTDAKRDELRVQAAKLKDEWEYEQGRATLTLAVFGESEVVHALAEHWRRTEPLGPCKGDRSTELNFYKKLREKAMGGDANISDSDLAELTIRCVP